MVSACACRAPRVGKHLESVEWHESQALRTILQAAGPAAVGIPRPQRATLDFTAIAIAPRIGGTSSPRPATDSYKGNRRATAVRATSIAKFVIAMTWRRWSRAIEAALHLGSSAATLCVGCASGRAKFAAVTHDGAPTRD